MDEVGSLDEEFIPETRCVLPNRPAQLGCLVTAVLLAGSTVAVVAHFRNLDSPAPSWVFLLWLFVMGLVISALMHVALAGLQGRRLGARFLKRPRYGADARLVPSKDGLRSARRVVLPGGRCMLLLLQRREQALGPVREAWLAREPRADRRALPTYGAIDRSRAFAQSPWCAAEGFQFWFGLSQTLDKASPTPGAAPASATTHRVEGGIALLRWAADGSLCGVTVHATKEECAAQARFECGDAWQGFTPLSADAEARR